MKNSELKELVSEYKQIKKKRNEKYVDSFRLSEKIKEIERRYFHETGRSISSDTKLE